jgi:hypothetical protein
VLYNRYCARCHLFGRGILPDLRRMSAATHGLFKSIVQGGLYAPQGMGRFDDVLSPADTGALHAYLIDQAWRLKAEPAPAPASAAQQPAPAPAPSSAAQSTRASHIQ